MILAFCIVMGIFALINVAFVDHLFDKLLNAIMLIWAIVCIVLLVTG